MANDAPSFDHEGIVRDTGSSSSGSYTPTVAEVPEAVAEFIIDAVDDTGGLFELPAFARDAPDFPEEHAEYYGLGDVETLSVEDMFGYDWEDTDFVGTPPLVSADTLTDDEKEPLTEGERYKSDGDEKAYVPHPDHVEAFRDANVADGATTELAKGINGAFSDAIVDRFGQESAISVGKGKDRLHGKDPVEARKHVAFWVTDSETAQHKRIKAQRDAGNLSEEEYRELAEQAGYDPDE